jgi:hypothetical protein
MPFHQTAWSSVQRSQEPRANGCGLESVNEVLGTGGKYSGSSTTSTALLANQIESAGESRFTELAKLMNK